MPGPTFDETTPRDELIEALLNLNGEAANTHPSPRWASLHHEMNRMLDLIVGR